MTWMLLLGLALGQPTPPSEGSAPSVMDVLDHRDELMAVLAKHDPRQHARMERLEQTDPQAFALGLVRVARTVKRLQDDPAAAERHMKIREESRRMEELARGFSELSKADQKRRRGELEAGARRLMDLKQEERRARAQELRDRIAELEADIEARDKAADELVEAFVDQLISEPVDL